MTKIITLKVASVKMSAAADIVRNAYRGGLYEGLTRPTGVSHKDLLIRHGVLLPDVPLLLEATWEYVLHTNHGRRRRGPWIPSELVAKWLNSQIALRKRVRAGEPNPNIMTSLADDLEIDARRLYAWVHAQYQFIEYSVLEDALWAFGCMHPEDICDRSQMLISRPKEPKGGNK